MASTSEAVAISMRRSGTQSKAPSADSKDARQHLATPPQSCSPNDNDDSLNGVSAPSIVLIWRGHNVDYFFKLAYLSRPQVYDLATTHAYEVPLCIAVRGQDKILHLRTACEGTSVSVRRPPNAPAGSVSTLAYRLISSPLGYPCLSSPTTNIIANEETARLRLIPLPKYVSYVGYLYFVPRALLVYGDLDQIRDAETCAGWELFVDVETNAQTRPFPLWAFRGVHVRPHPDDYDADFPAGDRDVTGHRATTPLLNPPPSEPTDLHTALLQSPHDAALFLESIHDLQGLIQPQEPIQTIIERSSSDNITTAAKTTNNNKTTLAPTSAPLPQQLKAFAVHFDAAAVAGTNRLAETVLTNFLATARRASPQLEYCYRETVAELGIPLESPEM